VLPASALRGALRASLEMLLRGAGEPACSGGNGAEPGADPARGAADGCALDAGNPCKACRLFGSARAGMGPDRRRFSSLVLGDATAPADEIRTQRGAGLAVRRAQRTSAAGRRYEYRLVELYGTLLARGRLLDAELAPLLEAAARATQHIGGRRSRGFGRVELRLHWLEAETADAPELPRGDTAGIRLRLSSPAAIGTATSPPVWARAAAESADRTRGDAGAGAARENEHWRDTRREIPGSALRGAVGTALAEQLEDPASDPAFAALCDDLSGARFGFLYPVRGEGPPSGAAALAGPWPITARVCSVGGHDHGLFDTLLERVRAACALTPEEAERAWSARRSACPRCAAGLTRPLGTRRSVPSPRVRLHTRNRLDRAHGSAQPGAIFAQAWLDPDDDVLFEGTIRSIPAQSRALLARALGGPLSVGRGISLGHGQVEIEVFSPPSLEALEERGSHFDRALREQLDALGFDAGVAGDVVPITLLAPLVTEREDSDGREELAGALGLQPQWLVCARRFAVEGGFDQRSGRASPVWSVAAGSVYAARMPGGWRERSGDLERLEREGAGSRRHQGFGQLICFDPLILQTSIGEAWR